MSISAELRFSTPVMSLRLRRDIFSVVLEDQIYTYRKSDLILNDIIPTLSNRKGLCCLNSTGTFPILAYLEKDKGTIAVKFYQDDTIRLIKAFEIFVAYMEMNQDGSLLACASVTGKQIRVFSTESKELLYTLHRGIDKAVIHCIAFHPTLDFLAVTSDRGTIHVYRTGESEGRKDGKSVKKMIAKYFVNQTSYAQFKLKNTRTICCFAKDNSTVILVTEEGEYLSINYSEPGECQLVERYNLLEIN